MGNWRTINITGTCNADEVDALRDACNPGDDYANHHCLATCGSNPSICGLNQWPAEKISAIGNLAERDYTVDDVAAQLRKLVEVASSLTVKVHCGDDYETTACIATITVADGKVSVGPPEVAELMDIPAAQISGNIARALGRF